MVLAADSPRFFGDFRYRYERIDQEDNTTRNRHRLRATLGLKQKIEDKLIYQLALRSGTTSPVAANQTFDGAASSKTINLDLAHFNYQLHPNAELVLGKMKNPFYRPGKEGLVWDSDLRPEAFALSYKKAFSSIELNLALSHFELEERSDDTNAAMDGIQAFFTIPLGASDQFILGASVFDYSGVKGRATLYDTTDSFGNSTTSSLYQYNYTLQELFVVYNTQIFHQLFSLFIDYVQNDDVSKYETAYLAGFSIGKAKKQGDWQISYHYRKVEKDSVLGVFSDSDFKGGGTDGKGHIARFKYAVSKKSYFALSLLDNETSVSSSSSSKKYQRAKIDFGFKF
jgi:hypothetical protein